MSDRVKTETDVLLCADSHRKTTRHICCSKVIELLVPAGDPHRSRNASVYHQCLSSHEAGSIRCQEQERSGQLFGIADAAHRGSILGPLAKVRIAEYPGSHFAREPSRRESIDTDTPICPTDGKVASQVDDRCLGCLICRRKITRSAQSEDRGLLMMEPRHHR